MSLSILIPCHNEALTIGSMVKDLKKQHPTAQIWVCANACTDDTATLAQKAGAHVVIEPRPGKGHATRRLIRAALHHTPSAAYVMLDGDSTYHTPSLPKLVETLHTQHLAMVVGKRVHSTDGKAEYRAGHQLGNRLFTGALGLLFGHQFTDIFSGYRAFSHAFLASFPCHSQGFEIETELSVHALQLNLPVAEIPTPYAARPQGSHSKLRTYHDGARIAGLILHLFASEKPLRFFGLLALLAAFASTMLFIPVLTTYLDTGLVPRQPTLIASIGAMLAAILLAVTGLLLQHTTSARREVKLLTYLTSPHA